MQWSRAVRAAGHNTSTDAMQGASVKGARSRSRRFASALVVVAGIVPLLFSACGLPGGSTGTSLAQDQTLTYPYTNLDQISEVVLDPAAISYAADSTFTSMLYSGLVTYSPDLTVVGDAAATWDIDSTGKVYTFHLRPNLHFSDGTPLTAADFAYSINRALDPHFCDKLDAKAYPPEGGLCPPQGYVLAYLGHIVGATAYNSGTGPAVIGTGNNPATGVNVLDPQTLQIRLDSPIGYFLEALTYPFSYPVEQKFVDRYPGGIWVQHLDEGGTDGPFKVAQYDASSKPQQIVLEPNPYWEQAWGKKLTLTKVIRPLYSSNTDEYNAYRAGNFDYTDVPVQSYFTARGQSDFNEVPALSETYFSLNFDQPPFNNKQVRQAFSLALNKQLLVDRVENGGAIPTNHIVPKGMPGYNPDLLTPGSDPTQSLTGNQTDAVNLLKAAQATCNAINPQTGQPPAECPFISGTNLQPIKIYVNSANTTRVAIADFAAQQWSTILKLNVQAVPTDPAELRGNISSPGGPYQMWIIGWLADYPDPQDWLSLQFTSNPESSAAFPHKLVNGNNVSDIHDPNLDTMLKAADIEKDTTKRMEDYNKAEQLVVQDVPWIPYEQGKLIWRMRPWVRGFGLNPLGLMVDVEWTNVYIASH